MNVDTFKQQMDDLVVLVEDKINARIDQAEVQVKKGLIGANKSNKSITNTISKGLIDNKANREFEIKAGELFVSEVVSGTYVQPDYADGIAFEPFQQDVRALFPQGTTSSDTITVNRGVYASNEAAITSEGAQYPESTNTLNSVSFSMDKLTHRFDLSEEFIQDVSGASQFITAQIQGGLIEKVNANIITDIKANDTAFDTTSSAAFYQLIESAQEYDVIVAALNQLRIDSYQPNLVLLHPTDYARIALLKDSNNQYLKGAMFSGVGASIDGVRVAQSSAVTSGEFHVLDSVRFGRYYNREALTVRIGLDGNDFSSGTRTAIALHRGKLAVMDVKACISGSFASAKTALETV